jgi:phosphoglycerol transferase
MRGREGDIWAPVVAEPPKRMIETLVEAGFTGVYVDRAGYADGGAVLEAALGMVLGEDPIVSANARLAFFDVRAFADQYCEKQWDARRLCIDRLPLRVTYADGFYGPEEANGDHFQWCSEACEIEIINPGPGTRRVHLRGWVRSASPSPFRLDLNHETFQVPTEGSVIDTALDVPKGTRRVRGTSDSPPIKVGVDPRQLSWRLDELTVADE